MSEISAWQSHSPSDEHTLSSRQTRPTLSTYYLAGDKSHYRSKIFNTSLGINPLVAAASPLLAFACQIADSQPLKDMGSFYPNLHDEIKAFEYQAKAQGLRSESILIARYLLCATLDELLIYTPNGICSDAQENRLLMFFHEEETGNERFFVLLERLSLDPTLYLDLLELIYLCLSVGFIGKYRYLPAGKETLEGLTSRLFEMIRWARGDLKKPLNILPEAPKQTSVSKVDLPWWLMISFILALLLTLYSSYSYLLGNSAEQLYQQLTSINTPFNSGGL